MTSKSKASPGGAKQTDHSTNSSPAGAPSDDARARQERVRSEFERPRFSFHYPEHFKPLPRKWLVQKIVPENALGVVFGPSAAGKSTFLTALCCSVATGALFLGQPCKRRGIIYVACEDAEGVMYRREAWIVKHEAERTGMAFAVVPEAPDLWSVPNEGVADIDLLVEQIQEERRVQCELGAETGIVVLDTSRKAFPGMKEIDSADVDRMCRIARRIIRECGVTVIFASHVAVGGSGEDPRGSGGYLGDVDFAIGVRNDQGVRQAWVRKMRNGKDADSDDSLRWAYHLRTVELGFAGEDGEPETAAVFQESGDPPPSPKAKASRSPPGGAQIVLRAVTDLLSENKGEVPPPSAQFPPGCKAVRVGDVLERVRAYGISKASCKDQLEASRKAFERGKEYWIERRGLLERDGWIAPPQ